MGIRAARQAMHVAAVDKEHTLVDAVPQSCERGPLSPPHLSASRVH